MGYLEIIRLRSLQTNAASVFDAIAEVLARGAAQPDLQEIRIYTHRDVGGDLAVHLLRPSAAAREDKSPLGCAVAGRLRAFGLVDHAIWKEVSS